MSGQPLHHRAAGTPVVALSMNQPWATLAIGYGRTVDNRPWGTLHRGLILVQATTQWDPAGVEAAAARGIVVSDDPANYPRKAIIGSVYLSGCCELSLKTATVVCDCGPWAEPGRVHLLIGSPRELARPVPCAGWQRVWRPPAEIVAKVAAQGEGMGLG